MAYLTIEELHERNVTAKANLRKDSGNGVSSRAEAVQEVIFAILVKTITAEFRESSSYTTEKLVFYVQGR